MSAPPEPTSDLQETGLVVALRSLTDGVTGLVTNHLRLAQVEVKIDALEIGKDIAGILVAGVLALIGYVFLLISALLFAAWYNIAASALVALALALIHLGGGLYALKALTDAFAARHYGAYTNQAITRSTKWAKKIQNKEL
ncbi:MAG: phage holin family protein [Myxococcota bacterium]